MRFSLKRSFFGACCRDAFSSAVLPTRRSFYVALEHPGNTPCLLTWSTGVSNVKQCVPIISSKTNHIDLSHTHTHTHTHAHTHTHTHTHTPKKKKIPVKTLRFVVGKSIAMTANQVNLMQSGEKKKKDRLMTIKNICTLSISFDTHPTAYQHY